MRLALIRWRSVVQGVGHFRMPENGRYEFNGMAIENKVIILARIRSRRLVAVARHGIADPVTGCRPWRCLLDYNRRNVLLSSKRERRHAAI